MATQPSYLNLRYRIPRYSLIYHHGVDLFFSALSAEKKKHSPSAHSATLAKRAVENILSPTRHSKTGIISIAASLRDCITKHVNFLY